MKCPKCSSIKIMKVGLYNKLNCRYQCKNCGILYTQFPLEKRNKEILKHRVLSLYGKGIKIRTIEKLLKVNHATIFNWIGECKKLYPSKNGKDKKTLL